MRRYPELPTLAFRDGRPFASEATQAWIEAEVMPSSSGEGGGGPVEDPELADALTLLEGGERDEALSRLGALGQASSGGRSRFRATLALGKALAQGSTLAAAEGVFAGLARTIERHGLEQWEPALAAECYRAELACLRQIKRPNDPELAARTAEAFRRLARVDPLGAASS